MESLLFLCHRLPWPPDKGDKIRSYHVLRHLASRYHVHLGTFVDNPADWAHVGAVRELCADTCIRPLPRWRMRARSVGALLHGEALSIAGYRDRVLHRWVEQLVHSRRVEGVLCYSSAMAAPVMPWMPLRRVMDFVDADSDKWRQYAAARGGIARWLFAREAHKVAAHEDEVARRFDAGIFVSDAEAAFFRQRAPDVAARIHGVANGVDTDYWNPAREYANPYAVGARAAVFTGAMDYRANVDAVCWYARKVWPAIAARCPQAVFCIVGSRPARAVRELAREPGIVVTGQVADVRPYLAHAHVAVAPLRVARGIQNKVLEALAMQKVVLATAPAWEGIDDYPGRCGLTDATVASMIEHTLGWLALPRPGRDIAARLMIAQQFDWARNLDAYTAVLRGSHVAAAMPGRPACEPDTSMEGVA